ncbi:predicted protein [Chaetomium globosum CBS 148.51]|uniref:Uncharacterized protein n=1 Tax=Chaetomium globosum (strain ATCC 6205 / CBS 148.51 / DSM 1962 / NBRC 6347 / NRRL 1970) TaxID=306901 RepID=Q2H9N0_CHAGB|nr:uncharacterized protein CHGG_03074 [Chaetomium globosum CBS 148.51]EAQ91139.1 predicted protein [Chaetomium globosum CBS 148.51]
MTPPITDSDSASCGPSSCSPTAAGDNTLLSTTIALTPALLTFALASFLALTRLFPHLARLQQPSSTSPTSSGTKLSSSSSGIALDDGADHFLPASAPPSLRQAHAEQAARSPRRRLAAAAFAATIGLSAVLAELILAEILELRGWLLGAHARAAGLRVTVPTLVGMLVGVVPFLEAQSVLASRGWRFGRDGKGRVVSRAAWVVLGLVFVGWLAGFWFVGRVVTGLGMGWAGGVDEELRRLAGMASAEGPGEGA